jgi:hypothetical protein
MTLKGAIAQEIAQALGETERKATNQIAHLTRLLGAEQVQALLTETQQIEASGGMMLPDGSRRRTPGGVFFQLARKLLTKEQRTQVFGSFKRQKPSTPKVPSASEAAQPTTAITWAERGSLIADAHSAPGALKTVKVTLIGRPAKTVERKDFTLLLMKHAGPLPSLPKGIPVPAKVPETSYVVYVGAKQWRNVKEALQNPDDALIVEGTQFYDQEYEAIAVFATNTTTKLLQQAKRQSPG